MLIRKLAPIVTAALLLTGTKASAVGWEHYDRNPDFEPQVLPSGAVANFDDWKRVMPYSRVGPGIEVAPRLVTDNVWMFDGIFYAPVVIETEEGLLVFSTGENAEEGALFRKLIREQISEKPIIGVFYDHAHYPFGAATLLDGDEAIIVAHPDHNRIIRESGLLANPIIPEMLPHMDGRTDIQFGNSHPNQGPDAPIGTVSLSFDKERAWLPATRTVEHGEIITVGGVEIQSFHAVTDTEDTLTFWLPDKKLVIDNAVWPTIPNIYTLRGDRFRPPMLWVQALKDIRDLKPEIVLDVGGGAKAMEGADFIQESLTALIDTISFLYDQTIRLTNRGVPSYELAHHITLPDNLAGHPFVNQVYGQFEHHLPRIVGVNTGWFSGRGEDMHRLPRVVQAENMIKLAGGEASVMDAYKDAMGKSQFLWAKELATYLYYSDTANAVYRQALADVLRTLGQYSPGSIARNFYTASALSLEGDKSFTLGKVQKADWVSSDYARAVDHLRTRINPQRASGQEGVLQFDIDETVAALHIRNSIAEFVANPTGHYRDPDAYIKVSGEDFTAYFRGEITASELLKRAKVSGDAATLLGVFDAFEHIPMYP